MALFTVEVCFGSGVTGTLAESCEYGNGCHGTPAGCEINSAVAVH